MLNLFQHDTNIACDLQYCKILNSLKIEPEIKVRNYITKNAFLRFQDDNEHLSRPSCLPAESEGIRAIVQLLSNPISVSTSAPLAGEVPEGERGVYD